MAEWSKALCWGTLVLLAQVQILLLSKMLWYLFATYFTGIEFYWQTNFQTSAGPKVPGPLDHAWVGPGSQCSQPDNCFCVQIERPLENSNNGYCILLSKLKTPNELCKSHISPFIWEWLSKQSCLAQRYSARLKIRGSWVQFPAWAHLLLVFYLQVQENIEIFTL